MAENYVSYKTGFEPADIYTWAANITGEVVAKSYGGNDENKALKIERGKTLDTLSYGTVIENPVTGNLIFSLDIRFDSDSGLADLDKYTNIRGINVYLKNQTASESKRAFDFLSLASNNTVRLRLGAVDDGTVDIPTNQWHRLQMTFSPTTGKANFICIKNIDGSGEKDIATLSDYALAAPGACIGADRILLSNHEANSYYIDNINFSQIPSFVEVISSTPVNEAENVTISTPVSFTFNNEIATSDITINSSAASFIKSGDGKTLTYSGALAYDTEYVIKGLVTDIYGTVYSVNCNFITENGLSMSNAYFQDENGVKIENGISVAKPTYVAKVTNEGNNSQRLIFTLVAINSQGRLIDVVYKTIDVDGKDFVDISESFAANSNVADCTIKAFFASSENLAPVLTRYELMPN